MRAIQFDGLLTPSGWLTPGAIDIDAGGTITAVRAPVAGEPSERIAGFAVPGLPNLHSHAFQRALSGLTERAIPGATDDFWTWRTQMYALAAAITPDDLQAIAAQLYVEMLEAGMTACAEFHYLHHDRDGARFAVPHQMSQAILAARAEAGIALTLLPVLYLHGGFGAPALPRQARFVVRDVDEFLALHAGLAAEIGAARSPEIDLGIAPHSLRAVTLEALAAAAAHVHARDARAPVHIHVAEQTKEVEEAIAALGVRPVRALLDRIGIDRRFTLVHATHLDPAEVEDLARSGAVAGLCPTTEANLGDGLFPAPAYLAAGGAFGVGSDSQASVSVTEEIRLLEYGQRLSARRRNVLLAPGQTGTVSAPCSIGEGLYTAAARGGAQSLARPAGQLAAGRRADIVVLDRDHPRLAGHRPATMIDAWIFGAADGAVREVLVGGETVVREGRHLRREVIARRFRAVMAGLLARAGVH